MTIPRRAMSLLGATLSLATCRVFAQTSSQSKISNHGDAAWRLITFQSSDGRTRTDSTYAMLRPEQKRLVDDYVRRYTATTGTKIVPQQAYDNARISVRTTFDAVTHALLRVKLTDAKGRSLTMTVGKG